MRDCISAGRNPPGARTSATCSAASQSRAGKLSARNLDTQASPQPGRFWAPRGGGSEPVAKVTPGKMAATSPSQADGGKGKR